ncbi:MAG: Calx-beta domain-containing protein, partial [Oscillochloridaceae bacterium umkhey_bin13]
MVARLTLELVSPAISRYTGDLTNPARADYGFWPFGSLRPAPNPAGIDEAARSNPPEGLPQPSGPLPAQPIVEIAVPTATPTPPLVTAEPTPSATLTATREPEAVTVTPVRTPTATPRPPVIPPASTATSAPVLVVSPTPSSLPVIIPGEPSATPRPAVTATPNPTSVPGTPTAAANPPTVLPSITPITPSPTNIPTITLTPTNPVVQPPTVTGVPTSIVPPGVAFSTEALVASEAEGRAVFAVRLERSHSSPVTVRYQSADGSARANLDYVPLNGTLTFAPGEISKTLTVEIIQDTIVEVPETMTLRLSDPVNARLSPPAIATLTILDSNVPPQVRFVGNVHTVPEGIGTTSVLIELSQVSGIDVAVPFTVSGTASFADHTLRGSTVIIPAGASSALLRFAIIDDRVDEDDETISLSLGTPTNAQLGSPASYTITILDDDVAGVNLSQTNFALDEGMGTTYAVVLNSQPIAPVTVEISHDAQLQIEPTILSFAPTTWDVPQVVTLIAVDDRFDEPDQHEGRFNHTIRSADPRYEQLPDQPGLVLIRDNDTAGVFLNLPQTLLSETPSDDNHTITYTVQLTSQPTAFVVIDLAFDAQQIVVTPTRLTFTPALWDLPQTVTVTARDDEIDEALIHPAPIRHGLTSADPLYHGPTHVFPEPVARLEISDNDSAAVKLNRLELRLDEDPASPSHQGLYAVSLATQPVADVTVTLTLSPTDQLEVSRITLLFTPQNWVTQQPIIVTAIDDAIDEGGNTNAERHLAQILHQASSADPNYNNPANPDLQPQLDVRIRDNDTAGVQITAPTTTFTEGGSLTYTVRLTSQPTANVTVRLEAPLGGLLNPALPASLTFTAQNWDVPQPVLVARPDNQIDEPDYTLIISHTVTSTDRFYDQLTPTINGVRSSQLSITILDNDIAGVIVTTNTTTFTEGGSVTYTLRLATQPTAEVQIDFGITPTGVLSQPVAPLTFTAANWNLPQTVTVAAPDNQIDELDRVVVLAHNVTSADPFYNRIATATVTVTVLDNDTAGLIVLTNTTTFTEGGSITYTVQLATEPTANVVVSFAPTPTGVISPALAPLTFTATNWNLPRT